MDPKKDLSPVVPAQKVGNFETTMASQTPEKTTELIRVVNFVEEESVMSLDKLKAIQEVFNCFTCSLRWLTLKKKSLTFQSISIQVQVLAKRKFLYGHLAQIKYIVPEAIHITNVLVHDKQTLCMKPDMKIELLLDVVDGHNELSDYIALQKLFASRLNNFFAAHPEACAIPEAILPEPFNRTTQTSLWEENLSEVSHCQSNLNIVDNTTVPEQSPGESSTQPQGTDPLSQFSLVHPSFKRHFSTKIIAEMQKTELLPSPAPLLPTSSYSCDAKDIPSQLQDFPDSISKSAITVDKDIRTEQPQECAAASSKFTIASVSPCNIESPMSKPTSSSDNLVVETPAQLTPRRSMPSCDEKLKMTSGHNLSASNKPAKRSLKFSTLECDISTMVEDSTVDRPHLDKVKCDNSVQGLEIEKVKKSVVTDLAKDCKKMSDGLVDLVTLINYIFQSANRSSITKEELIHKIIINDFDTVERGEVQEKIELLEKLVPDWISRKLVSSGDTLYSIQKASDMELVQSRLKMSGKAGSECRL